MRTLMQLAARGTMLAAALGCRRRRAGGPGQLRPPLGTGAGDLLGHAQGAGSPDGSYPHGVSIKGLCEVDAGTAKVHGNLTVLPAGAILADYAVDDRAAGRRLEP